MRKFLTLLCAALFLAVNVASVFPAPKAVAEPINLIPNPSVEESINGLPTGWTNSKQGINTATFTYLNSGRTGNKSLEVSMTQRSSGNARWHFRAVNVSPSTTYTFSDWYKSNVTTYIQPVVTRTNGSTTTLPTTTVSSSADWKQRIVTITTPSNAKSITVYHYIRSVGKIATDDFALTPPATNPTVQITSPSSNSTISGSQTISANATDTHGIVGVQFKVDGVNLGAEDTIAPYQIDWDTNSATNGNHVISATARNTANLTSVATVNVNVQNVSIPPPPPPTPVENLIPNGSFENSTNGSPDGWLSNSWGSNTASFTYENTGRTGSKSATTTVSQYSSGDAKWYFSPINIVAGKNYDFSVYYKSTVSTEVVAQFTDAAGVNTYQWMGTAPTSANWAKFEHSLTVPSGVAKISIFHVVAQVGALTIDDMVLSEVVTPPVAANLVPNPSLESASNSTTPSGWTNNKWGTNTASFEYLNSGRTGNKSVKVTVSNYVDGDAKWYFNPISNLERGKQYRFTTWYKTNTTPQVVAMFVKDDNTEKYFGMPQPFPTGSTTEWQKYTDTFSVPVDAKAVSVFMFVNKNGWVQTDDYSIEPYQPVGFNRALVSLTFDDGHEDNVGNALPVLNSYGFKSTQCYATDHVEGQPQAIQGALAFYNSGHEICSHTVSHPFLTQVSTSQLTYELTHSKSVLEGIIGQQVRNFASPYGDYNAAVNNQIDNYYRSHRTVDEGYNTKDNLNLYRLRVQNVQVNTTLAEYQSWLDAAKRDKTWLILVYHRVANDPGQFDTRISDFNQQMQALSNSGLTVKTYNSALDEVIPQL